MIVRMRKVTILVSEKDAHGALQALRKLGLIHVKHMHEPTAHRITSIENRLLTTEKVLGSLNSTSVQKEIADKELLTSSAKEIIACSDKKQELISRLEELGKKLVWFKEWGNISLSSLAELKKSGVFIKLYVCTGSELKRISPEKLVYVIRKAGRKVYAALVSTDHEESLGFAEAEIPHEDMRSLERKISAVADELEYTNRRLLELSAYRNCFLKLKDDLLRRLEFYKVKFGMAHQGSLCCLQGFCPRGSVPQITKLAQREGWGTIIEEPDNPAEVPTLIRNPRWIEIIKPVFKFMGTSPGYAEFDISLPFLIFFSIFFAMLIGDAGYGILFLIFTFSIHKRFRSFPREIFLLIYVLSWGTIIWGAVTGTWFGFEEIAQLPVLNSLVVGRINSFVDSNQIFMIHLCFLIGAIHLTIAHGIKVFRFINSWSALAQVGWMCIIWGTFFVAGRLILDRPLPDFALLLGIVGAALVVLFSAREKNILKGAFISLANLPLKIISSFSDIVSYLRLFAVGYATVAVASTFNNMALGTGFNSFLAGGLSALILFFGHLLNIILGLMAVIVHGLRLNMLEFSGHLDMEWSGKEYKPFKE